MDGCCEVLISSEASGQLWNTCIWEPHSGTSLMTFKGGSTGPRTLSLLSNDYIIGGVSHKPLIHVWALHRKDQMQMRIVCPGQVTALATSPDGCYCVAAVDDKLHLWQVSTGHLLAVLTRHYQTVRCLKFTDDGSHFISGGDDNFVGVWSLGSVLSSRSDGNPSGIEPRWLWTSHSLPITDMHVGCGGAVARVATVSLDQTCRLWEIRSGQLLCTIVFDNSLTSVVMDNAESRLFVGALNGNICQINLYERPVKVERHFNEEQEGSLVFRGHSKQVTCLAVSLDGTVLASGSHDASVKLWDILSRQCTRTIPHKGVITNMLLVATPRGLLGTDSRPTLPIQQFQRHLHNTDTDGLRETLSVRLQKRKIVSLEQSSENLVDQCLDIWTKKDCCKEHTLPEEIQEELKKKLGKLSQINRDIYNFTLSRILDGESKSCDNSI